MSLRVVSAPAAEPLTLADAKAHLRVDGTDEDTGIAAMIAGARDVVEAFTGRALIDQTLRYGLDAWPSTVIRLPRVPLLLVDGDPVVTIAYVDADGMTQTLSASAYKVDADAACIAPAYGTCWPTARDEIGAVQVTYRAGYGADSSAVPAGIVAALKLIVADLYQNREPVAADSLSPTVRTLLNPYRVWWF